MKKIKEFFKKQKQRFVSWYSNTFYPVKRVILLLTLCFFVSFSIGSCSTKKPYKEASAASASESNPVVESYIDFFTNYNGQLWLNNGNTSLTKVICSFHLRMRPSGLYLVRPNIGEVLIPNFDTWSGSSDPEYGKVPLYYMVDSGDHYVQAGIETYATHTNAMRHFSKLLDGSVVITEFYPQSSVSSTDGLNWNNITLKFNMSDKTFFDIEFNRPKEWGAVPQGFDFDDTDYPRDYVFFNYVVHNANSSLYNDGFNEGYKAGKTDGYNAGYTAGENAGQSGGYDVGYEKGQSDGYKTGFDEGYTAGETEGGSNGYKQGYNKGQQDGYNKGISETLSDISPWQILTDGVNSLFNAKLFGTVSLSVLLSVGLGIILFTIFMRSLR